MISGIRFRQLKDYSFIWDMQEYADDKLKMLEPPRGLITTTKELDDKWIGQILACNGKIGWLGSNGRPDIAAGHSIIAGKVKDKSPELITLCNQVVKQVKRPKFR